MNNTNKKFKLTDTTKVHAGTVLYQIEALSDGRFFSKGDLGGYIEKESNLSQAGDAWVYEDALVSGNAKVSGDARVFGDAWVYGNAKVSGDAWVFGNAQVSGSAQVFGDAWVYGNAKVSGNALVSGDAEHCVSPLQIQGTTRHFFNVDFDKGVVYVQVGCHRKTLAEWLKIFAEVGKKAGYSDSQIKEYGEYLKLCKRMYGLKLKETK